MDALTDMLQIPPATPIAVAITIVAIAVAIFIYIKSHASNHSRRSTHLPPVPEVPGVPVLGNLLQLKEKKPYMTFTRWAQTYGPIYSIRTGATSMVVVSSNEIAKEAMVTRFSSISTRNLSKALTILTADKTMVAMSDYNDYHRTVKRHILTAMLGPNAQAVGKDVESLNVEDLGITMKRDEIFQVLAVDPMMAALEFDWRDFFPYLKWVPNKKFENMIQQMYIRRKAVMKALIKEHKKRIASGENLNSYIDYMISEAQTFTDEQLIMLLWEPIIESSDTTMVATEWAMYELTKSPKMQDHLYRDIQSVCGSRKITEENLSHLPYLSAIFHETLRRHSPAPMIPLRHVHEDIVLGGYHVPAGTELTVNIYGCNMEKNVWENPEEYNPDRFMKENETTDMHKTMSFGGGKRVCAGSLQAMLISCIGIGRMVQEFEWRFKDKADEEDINTIGLTTQRLNPLRAIIKPRN